MQGLNRKRSALKDCPSALSHEIQNHVLIYSQPTKDCANRRETVFEGVDAVC